MQLMLRRIYSDFNLKFIFADPRIIFLKHKPNHLFFLLNNFYWSFGFLRLSQTLEYGIQIVSVWCLPVFLTPHAFSFPTHYVSISQEGFVVPWTQYILSWLILHKVWHVWNALFLSVPDILQDSAPKSPLCLPTVFPLCISFNNFHVQCMLWDYKDNYVIPWIWSLHEPSSEEIFQEHEPFLWWFPCLVQ